MSASHTYQDKTSTDRVNMTTMESKGSHKKVTQKLKSEQKGDKADGKILQDPRFKSSQVNKYES